MAIRDLFKHERTKKEILANGFVKTDPFRCVQCGICSFHCPMNIDVRRFAWLGQAVHNSHCLTCGECVQRCPRSALSFEYENKGGPISNPGQKDG